MYKNISRFKNKLPTLFRIQNDNFSWHNTKRHMIKALPNINKEEEIPDITESAFRNVKSSDIFKSLIIFNLCSIKSLVNNADKIIKYSKSVIGETIPSQLLKNTLYHQFCGGELNKTVEFLKLNNVSIMVDIATDYIKDINKAEFQIETNYKGILECIDKTAEFGIEGVKFTPVKLAGLCKYYVLEALAKSIKNNNTNLTIDILDELKLLEQKISEIITYAKSKNIKILIDAEDYKLQPAIDLLALRAAEKFNDNRVNVFNTYQLYLKDSYQKLKMDIEYFKFKNKQFGAKLVRGAYLIQERTDAHEYNYPCPIFDEKSKTDYNFDKTIEEIMEEMKKGSNIEIFIGSHNKDSIEKVIQKMTPSISKNVYFGQLYGMADYLSFILGHMNYQVVKLVPYGPLNQVIPYLIRRAQENSDALGSVKNDISVLKLILYKRLKKTI